ncbi:alpha-ketoglutarate-dependent dioxygenase alkB homolog 3 isoform X3 [Sorex araneus]|uniref:alpha-ketoglutarate-dependent dioxygenase alkB homolog 3 isoform X3 n=1 Tax=Sorex araneus TaxID=42254 RepID=UPI0024337D51|nr:alpha-ketoglutarate-dependent dioxygenase alkB homolog 3 isoform X3 [Sorex araneus]
MEDKRRRARVQGAWSVPAKGQAPAPPGKALRGASRDDSTEKSPSHRKPGLTWANKELHPGDRQFLFTEPQQVARRVPEPRVIDKAGVYDISLAPTGVSRVSLYPGFVAVEEADRALEQLCRDVPWQQRTGIRELAARAPRAQGPGGGEHGPPLQLAALQPVPRREGQRGLAQRRRAQPGPTPRHRLPQPGRHPHLRDEEEAAPRGGRRLHLRGESEDPAGPRGLAAYGGRHSG